MTERLLHVSFVVKDTNLHALLISIEAHKVGNLEVRAVQPRLALPAPDAATKVGQVARYMVPGLKARAPDVARACNISRPAAANALDQLRRAGFLRKAGRGTFVRKNGAHAS